MVRIELGELDHAALVEDPQTAVEDVADHLEPGACEATRHLPQAAVFFEDVVGRDLARVAHDEAAVEVGLVVGEAQGAAGLPALPWGVALQGLVGCVVVAVEEVAKAKGQGAEIGIHVGGAVQGTQHLVLRGTVEALDGAAPCRVAGRAVDQPGAEPALDHGEGVGGDEAGTPVEVEQVRQPVPPREVVEPVQEEGGRLHGAHERVQTVAGGVVQEEERDPAQAGASGPEVFAVTQHALHTVRIAPPPRVTLPLARTGPGRQVHAPAGPPGRGAVHRETGGQDALDPRPAQQLGNTGPWVLLLLGAQEHDELLAQGERGVGPLPAPGREGLEAAHGVGRAPALERAYAEAHRTAVRMGMLPPGDLAQGRSSPPPTQHERLDLGEHRVAQERLGGGSGRRTRRTGRVVHEPEHRAVPYGPAPRKVVGGGLRPRGRAAPGRSGPTERGDRPRTHVPRAASQRRGRAHRPPTWPAARIRSSRAPSTGTARSTARTAAPRIVQLPAHSRAAPRSLSVGTPSRVAIRSRAPSAISAWTPTSRPASSNRRPWVRRRRGSSAGLSDGHRSPPAASTAAANSVASHGGAPVAASRSSPPDRLDATAASRPYGTCPGGYNV